MATQKKGIINNEFCNDLIKSYKEQQEQLVKEHDAEYDKEENIYRAYAKRDQVESVKKAFNQVADKRQLYTEECVDVCVRDEGHEKQIKALKDVSVHALNNNGTYDMRFKNNKQLVELKQQQAQLTKMLENLNLL